MKFTRERYQKGSLRRVSRKSGADVWEYRFRDHREPGSPMRQVTLSTLEYPTESKALVRLQEDLLRINGSHAYRAQNRPTLGVVIDRFSSEERIEDIVKQKPGETTITDGISYSTAAGYRSKLKRHIKPKWGNIALVDIKAQEVTEWLKFCRSHRRCAGTSERYCTCCLRGPCCGD